FRGGALPPDDLRHVHPVVGGRRDLRVAAPGRRSPGLLSHGQLGLLAHRARHRVDGPRAERAGPAARLHAHGRRRVPRHGRRHQALLVGADAHRAQHGRRHVAGGARPHEDLARTIRVSSIAAYAVGAGFPFVTLALFVQGSLQMLAPESRTRTVTRAVRTDLGDVKWVRYDASDYTESEKRGRAVYIREGCWYCHSQYVRPVAGEEMRWGPLSEAGEDAWDQPHVFSTRRIGPDLTRVGLKFSGDWHYARHWEPRLAAPEAMMRRSARLCEHA